MSLKGIAVYGHNFLNKFSMVVCSTWKVKMFLQIAVPVFLLLVRIRFLRKKSIAAIIRSNTVEKLLKLWENLGNWILN